MGTSVCALALLATLVGVPGGAAAAPLLYVVQENDPNLNVVDASDASTVSTQTVTLAGETVFGSSGLARQPGSGDLYALLWLQSSPDTRRLVTLDPNTGVATSIGDTSHFFTGLAFVGSKLYAVTHDDDLGDPRALYSLDVGTGASTFEIALSDSEGFGEALGSSGGLLYHASGYPDDPPHLFESLDPGNGFASSALSLTGDPFDEVLGITSDGIGGLYMTDFITPSGVLGGLYQITGTDVSFLGELDFPDARGLVLVPEPSSALLLAFGLSALGARRRVRR